MLTLGGTLAPVGAIDLVGRAPEGVGQLRTALAATPRGNVFADVDVAREHAVQQLLVVSLVHLRQHVAIIHVQQHIPWC